MTGPGKNTMSFWHIFSSVEYARHIACLGSSTLYSSPSPFKKNTSLQISAGFSQLIKNQWSSHLNKTQCSLGAGFQRRQTLIDKKEFKHFSESSKLRILDCRQERVIRKNKGNKPGIALFCWSADLSILFFEQNTELDNDRRLRAKWDCIYAKCYK